MEVSIRRNSVRQSLEPQIIERITMVPSQNAIPIGYFPKRVLARPERLKVSHVVDICSASECMSAGPADWINQWRHNAMWCFDSPGIAQSVVPVECAREFQMFAYRMLPLQFDDSTDTEFIIPSLDIESMSPTFDFLGFDAVSRFARNSFECSPLSCNGAAESEPVNPHCLIDNEAEIMRLAKGFAKESNGFEPGPYFIVEVWRRIIQ